jgi:hypothetical protein
VKGETCNRNPPLLRYRMDWFCSLYDVLRVLPQDSAVQSPEIQTAWVGNTWFVEPVLFLVDQFVKSYLKDVDPMGKWQDPLVANVALGKRSKGPSSFVGQALESVRRS